MLPPLLQRRSLTPKTATDEAAETLPSILRRHIYHPRLTRNHRFNTLSRLPSTQATSHCRRSRHIRPQLHGATVNLNLRPVLRLGPKPKPESLHSLRQAGHVRYLQRSDHNAPASASTASPRT